MASEPEYEARPEAVAGGITQPAELPVPSYAAVADLLSVSVTYTIIRNGIGVLALGFPFVLMAGGGLDQIQTSLSAYYHFSPSQPAQYGAGKMRDVFVGMLCTIGAFLLFYRGYSVREDIALNVAGIAAILIALFPMDWPAQGAPTMVAKVHSTCAVLFFVMIGYVCVFRAKDTLCILHDPQSCRTFRRIYLAIGVLMLATPAAIMFVDHIRPNAHNGFTTLMLEVAGDLVFASFWLIKGLEIRLSLRQWTTPSR